MQPNGMIVKDIEVEQADNLLSEGKEAQLVPWGGGTVSGIRPSRVGGWICVSGGRGRVLGRSCLSE